MSPNASNLVRADVEPATREPGASLAHPRPPVSSGGNNTAADAAAAYRSLAPFYDRVTADHDYERWIDMLEPLAVGHGLTGRRLLDVACGTGKSFAPFRRRGYKVVAADISAEMAARAADRGRGDVPVHVADMRTLPRLGEFDLAICLGDSLNYLDADDDLARAFTAIGRNLGVGGLLVFDVNTLRMYRDAFLVDRVNEDDDRTLFVWRGARSEPMAPGARADATVEVFSPDGAGAA